MKKIFSFFSFFVFVVSFLGLLITSPVYNSVEAKVRNESCDPGKRTSCDNSNLICYPTVDDPKKGICDFSREEGANCSPVQNPTKSNPGCHPDLVCSPNPSGTGGTCKKAAAGVPCNPDRTTSCNSSFNNTSNGFACEKQPDGSGVCKPITPGGLGGGCNINSPTSCPTGNICSPDVVSSAPSCQPIAPNRGCFLSYGCGPDFTCKVGTNSLPGQGFCVRTGGTGTGPDNICSNDDNLECDPGLVCTSKTKGIHDELRCQIPPEGYPCDPSVPNFCPSPLVCRPYKEGNPSNYCLTEKNEDYWLPPVPTPPCAKDSFDPVTKKCTKFDTALGVFSTNPEGFIASIFAVLLAASGGIALLLIIRAGYKIMTSQGKPEAIQEGRDQLIAAIVGLIFLIFSFVFLQLIGFDILRIPGFGGPAANVPAGGQCDASSNSQCAPGLTCVSQGGTKNGICKDPSAP